MKREFLDKYGLDTEAVDAILAENGRDISDMRAKWETATGKITELQGQVDTLTAQVADRDKDLTTLRTDLESAKGDGEKLTAAQTKIGEMETRYKADLDAMKGKLEADRYAFAVDAFLTDIDFASDRQRDIARRELMEKSFPLQDKTVMGAKEFIEALRESDPTAFKSKDTNGTDHEGGDGSGWEMGEPTGKPRFTKMLGSGNSSVGTGGSGGKKAGEYDALMAGFNRVRQPREQNAR